LSGLSRILRYSVSCDVATGRLVECEEELSTTQYFFFLFFLDRFLPRDLDARRQKNVVPSRRFLSLLSVWTPTASFEPDLVHGVFLSFFRRDRVCSTQPFSTSLSLPNSPFFTNFERPGTKPASLALSPHHYGISFLVRLISRLRRNCVPVSFFNTPQHFLQPGYSAKSDMSLEVEQFPLADHSKESVHSLRVLSVCPPSW